MVKIISFLYDTLGHTSYEYNLKNNIELFFPGTDYQIKKLSEFRSRNVLIRLLVKALTFDITINSSGLFFKRLRNELCLSVLGFLEISKYIDRVDIKLIVVRTQSIALLSSGLFRKKNAVLTLDITTAQLGKFQNKRFSYWPIVYLEKKAFQNCIYIITNSEYARLSVINDYFIQPEKVACIYPPVDERFFGFPMRDYYGVKTIIFVGNDFTRKGGHDLVNVFNEKFKDTCKLVIVSGSAEARQYDNLPNIKVYSHIQPLSNELIELYRSSHVFVLPTYEEAYGLVFSEAMATGLPCIGTSIMAIPELIEPGESGYLIQPGNRKALAEAISMVIADEEKLLKMSKKAYAIACKRFKPENNTEKFVQVFTQLACSDAII